MQDFLIYTLLTICIAAFAGIFVVIFNARIGTMEWWLGDEDAEDRPLGKLAFVRSNGFFYAMCVSFAGSALALMFILG